LSGPHAARHSSTELSETSPEGAAPEAPSKRRRNIIAGVAGAIVAAVLVVVAVSSMNLGPSKPASSNSAADLDRAAQERADRGTREGAPSTDPSVAPSPSNTPEPEGTNVIGTAPTKSPTPKASSKSPSPSPSKKPSNSPTTKAPTTTTSSGTCKMSYYETGSRTANGESFNPNGLTAAHKTLPFNTMVKITNLANGKSVTVRINDRGPFVAGRCIDLARGAFTKIASTGAGVVNAKYEVLK
jgi:rare lipoprotein A